MITIFDWFGYELPMDERYHLIKQAGFDGVMLWWSDDYGKSDYRKQPHAARKTGLFIDDIHTPFTGINNLWLDNLDGEDMTNILLKSVDECAEFEIPTMVMHLSGGDCPPPVNSTGLDRIKRIACKAEKLGVNVALENLRKTEYLSFIFTQIDSPRVGFCYDSGHHYCRTPNDDLLSMFGSRLMALHLHDNDGYISGASEEDCHKMPFDGTINWKAVMKKIAGTGYKGPVALEVVNSGYENLSAKDFLHIAFERAVQLEEIKNRN